jgi:hypothetical protein
MATARTPNSFLVFLGSLAALLLVAIIFVVSIASGPKPGDLDKKRADNRLAVRTQLENDARALIGSAGFVDKAKGIVHVPVASLFASTATELAAKKPAPSQVKVEPPLPMPVIDPNSTEPPPPAMPSAPQGADTVRFATPAPAAAAPAVPAPAKPAAAAIAPTAPIASSAPARPPLINWTESK